ncbi:hypothetical protein [uncultured Anaerovibrio sp.]|uniref:hypothetical protein n=1 Tax=uncultured Anaerovibrio sp. TaxID=361586 RepID=UPI002629C811|nr:hypothetical protein [uncultured Anaerovibrio sp.]
MKIQDIKSALNSKVSSMNITATQPTTSAPTPKATAATVPAQKKPETKPIQPKVEVVPATVEAIPSVKQTDNIDIVVAKILKANADYGIIPGCKKPSLLKAGAEKLAAYYGFSTSISIENRFENYDKKLVAYEVKVTVYESTGRIIAEGIGAANSLERKFLKGDFFSQINTVLKMCKKRAYVDAILTATGASSIFTQDMEDIGNVQTNQGQEAI